MAEVADSHADEWYRVPRRLSCRHPELVRALIVKRNTVQFGGRR